jgi:hypothetical protein
MHSQTSNTLREMLKKKMSEQTVRYSGLNKYVKEQNGEDELYIIMDTAHVQCV